MECLRGKRTFTMNRSELLGTAKTFRGVHLDLGTGDGRYACAIAKESPDCFSIAIDACRENLRRPSRRAPGNALFVIANALCLPRELEGLASRVSILFPWGSLLNSMLNADPALLRGLCMATGYPASIEVWVNAGAMAECGWGLQPGTERVRATLATAGFVTEQAQKLQSGEVLRLPSTWAKRLMYGRDPRVLAFSGQRQPPAGLAEGEGCQFAGALPRSGHWELNESNSTVSGR